MNLLVKIEDTAADDSIHKLIDRRIKEILSSDKYIQGRIDALLEAQISKRAEFCLQKYFDGGNVERKIAHQMMILSGVTPNGLAKEAAKEVKRQVTELLTPSIKDGNDKTILDIFKDEINNQESEG